MTLACRGGSTIVDKDCSMARYECSAQDGEEHYYLLVVEAHWRRSTCTQREGSRQWKIIE